MNPFKSRLLEQEDRPGRAPVPPMQVPEALKAIPQWVCWRWVKKGGKWTKVPVNPHTGRAASTTDPSTWGDFATALAMDRRRFSRTDGIGFVFSDDELSGIDLDDCCDPITGQVQPWAQKIVEDSGTYCEISPSKTGLKMIGRGKLPPGPNRRGNIEVYSRARYFTITGNRASPSMVLADLQPMLDLLQAEMVAEDAKKRADVDAARPCASKSTNPVAPHPDNFTQSDADLIERASATSSKFAALWAGSTSYHAGNHSVADLSLCEYLVFWCGPNAHDRILSLFRMSGLYREKWEEKRGQTTYGNMTVAKAYEFQTTYYDPGFYRRRLDDAIATVVARAPAPIPREKMWWLTHPRIPGVTVGHDGAALMTDPASVSIFRKPPPLCPTPKYVLKKHTTKAVHALHCHPCRRLACPVCGDKKRDEWCANSRRHLLDYGRDCGANATIYLFTCQEGRQWQTIHRHLRRNDASFFRLQMDRGGPLFVFATSPPGQQVDKCVVRRLTPDEAAEKLSAWVRQLTLDRPKILTSSRDWPLNDEVKPTYQWKVIGAAPPDTDLDEVEKIVRARGGNPISVASREGRWRYYGLQWGTPDLNCDPSHVQDEIRAGVSFPTTEEIERYRWPEDCGWMAPKLEEATGPPQFAAW